MYMRIYIYIYIYQYVYIFIWMCKSAVWRGRDVVGALREAGNTGERLRRLCSYVPTALSAVGPMDYLRPGC